MASEPGGKMVDLNAEIPADLHRRLGMAKYGSGKSIKEIVALALDSWLAANGFGPPPAPPAQPKPPKGK